MYTEVFLHVIVNGRCFECFSSNANCTFEHLQKRTARQLRTCPSCNAVQQRRGCRTLCSCSPTALQVVGVSKHVQSRSYFDLCRWTKNMKFSRYQIENETRKICSAASTFRHCYYTHDLSSSSKVGALSPAAARNCAVGREHRRGQWYCVELSAPIRCVFATKPSIFTAGHASSLTTKRGDLHHL